MNKDTLISKQQLEIEISNKKERQNAQLKKRIRMKFIAIGQPMNDNILKFNKEQLKWCASVLELVDQLCF